MTGSTVLITGASGFIAKHVLGEFLAHGYSVRGTVRSLAREAEVREAVGEPAATGRLEIVAADLLSDAGWAEAMAGVDAVVHTASPFPASAPRDEGVLIRPAVEGTRRVLGAAERAGVERIVLTSSVAAIHGGHPARHHFDASIWTDVDRLEVSAYYKSKTHAERAAWAHVAQSGQGLTTINPALVVGPPLDAHWGTSLDIVGMLLKGRFPALPRIAIGLVDVRDVARLHRLALETESVRGLRLAAADEILWFSEMARALKARYPDRRIPSRELPDGLVSLVSKMSRQARQGLVDVGKMWTLDTAPARDLLGGFIPAREALLASAEALIGHGTVK